MSPSRSSWPASTFKQTAVHWAFSSRDGFGVRTFVAGAEVSCRWEEKQQRFVTLEGDELVSRAIVYHAATINPGDYLYLGDLEDLDSGEVADPTTAASAYEVRGLGESTTLRDASRSLKKAMLV